MNEVWRRYIGILKEIGADAELIEVAERCAAKSTAEGPYAPPLLLNHDPSAVVTAGQLAKMLIDGAPTRATAEIAVAAIRAEATRIAVEKVRFRVKECIDQQLVTNLEECLHQLDSCVEEVRLTNAQQGVPDR